MTCVICKHGHTAAGEATVTLQLGRATLVFKQVPADVCDNCGEYYLSESITRELLRRAEDARKTGVEVEVLSFAA